MAIPIAVGPGQLTPGLYLIVDLLAGAASPGTGTLRVALMANKSSAGTLTEDTEVRAGGGETTAQVAFGIGTVGALAAKQIYDVFPAAVVDFIAPAVGAGLATLDLTAAGSPTSNTSVLLDVMGREFEVAWLSGESADDIKDKIIAAINQRSAELACVASSGGVGIVQIDSKVLGNVGNDIKVSAVLSVAQTGTETFVGAVVPTPLAGGTTDSDFTTALSNLEGREYPYIMPCLSNTDVANVSTQNNYSKTIDHINNFNTGLDAKLEQVVAGITTTIALATAATPAANGAQNDPTGELILCINGRGLPGELGGREVGGWLLGLSTDPAVNRIGEDMSSYIGAVDLIADSPTVAQSETALGNGVALVGYTAQGIEVLVRPVTTHSQDATGAPDRRLLDAQNVAATYIVARDIRSALPAEFPNAKLVKDTEPGEDPPPKGVIEERDIKAFVISRLRFFQAQGVITKQSLDTAIDGGTLIVQVNDSDASQVDIVLPFSIVPPLAKFGVVVQRVPN